MRYVALFRRRAAWCSRFEQIARGSRFAPCCFAEIAHCASGALPAGHLYARTNAREETEEAEAARKRSSVIPMSESQNRYAMLNSTGSSFLDTDSPEQAARWEGVEHEVRTLSYSPSTTEVSCTHFLLHLSSSPESRRKYEYATHGPCTNAYLRPDVRSGGRVS